MLFMVPTSLSLGLGYREMDIFDGAGNLNPVAGALTATTTTAREIQFAVKVIF